MAGSAASSGGAAARGCWCDSATASCNRCRGFGPICRWPLCHKSLRPTTVQRRCFHRRHCESWCVAFANCGSETMLFPVADLLGCLRTPSTAINRPARDRAVQREKNRVRWAWRRHYARAVRRDRADAWHTWRRWCLLRARTRSCDQAYLPRTVIDSGDAVTRSRGDRPRTRARTSTAIIPTPCEAHSAREAREGLAGYSRLRRRSSLDCDAGASRGPCDACLSASGADRPGGACGLRPIHPCDKILPTPRHRSASRDPRRWLARIHIHPVRRDRVPLRARARQGGAPA